MIQTLKQKTLSLLRGQRDFGTSVRRYCSKLNNAPAKNTAAADMLGFFLHALFMTSTLDRNRQRLLAILTILLSTAMCLLVVESALGWYSKRIANSSMMSLGLMRYESELGWALVPNWQGTHKHHDFSVTYNTNARGYREAGADKDSTLHGAAPTLALVGDSFTFGLGVDDNQTFAAQLNQRDPARQYLNLGIPGYSTDQQLILLKKLGPTLGAGQNIVVFYLGNDLLDNALPFPLQAENGKPLFELGNDQRLVLTNVPVPPTTKPAALKSLSLDEVIFGDELQPYSNSLERWAQRSQILQRLVPSTAKVASATMDTILQRRLQQQEQLLAALLVEIQQLSLQQQRHLTLALLPGGSYTTAPNSYSALFQDYVRRRVLAISATAKIDTLDIASELRQRWQPGQVWYHPHEGHLTVEGQQQVSTIIFDYLQSQKSP
jgi:hypothetical protein